MLYCSYLSVKPTCELEYLDVFIVQIEGNKTLKKLNSRLVFPRTGSKEAVVSVLESESVIEDDLFYLPHI